MAIDIQFKPIAEAIVKNLKTKDPNEVIFVIGKKSYNAKVLLKHFNKEDNIAENIIKMAINANSQSKILSLNGTVDTEIINKAVKMFEV